MSMSANRSDVARTVEKGRTQVRIGRPHWIDDWHPNDEGFWAEGGAQVARRNLVLSILTDHIAFWVWLLWSVWVLFLGPNYGFSAAQKFLLTAVPAGVGGVLRVPYTLAVNKFGGRNWTVACGLLLLGPCIAAAVLLHPGVSFSVALTLAAVAGIGGANFASSMANIQTFYPDRLQGWALGMNAGFANLGVAVIQLLGLAVLATAGKDHPRVLLAIVIPFVLATVIAAYLWMDNVVHAANEKRALRDATRSVHNWVISLLYIGSFGSFIGFSFAFGLVLQVQFHHTFNTPIKAAYLTFLGPAIGSLIRPVGGRLSDRLGGARVTLATFAAMAGLSGVILGASLGKSLPVFIVGFVFLFALTGLANGSVFKMIPAIFWTKGMRGVEDGVQAQDAVREAGRMSRALIGWVSAIGAVGGVFINLAFRESFLTYKNADAAYVGFIAFYAVCALITAAVYVFRPSSARLTR